MFASKLNLRGNFDPVSPSVRSTFGTITSTVANLRIIQFAAKRRF